VKKKVIILANQECLRAYNVITDDLATPTTKIEALQVDYNPLAPDPTDTSDDDGCFPGGSTVGHAVTMKHREAHGRKTEKKKRQICNLARAITKIVEQEQCDLWNLAIPENNASKLIKELPISIQQKLTQLKKGDYTWLTADAVGELFTN